MQNWKKSVLHRSATVSIDMESLKKNKTTKSPLSYFATVPVTEVAQGFLFQKEDDDVERQDLGTLMFTDAFYP